MWRYSAVWVIPSVRQRWCPRPSCWGGRFFSLETLRFSGIFQGFLAWNVGLCVSYDVLKATVVVQCLSCVRLFAAHQASLFFTISQTLLKLMSIELMRPSNHLILCHRPMGGTKMAAEQWFQWETEHVFPAFWKVRGSVLGPWPSCAQHVCCSGHTTVSCDRRWTKGYRYLTMASPSPLAQRCTQFQVWGISTDPLSSRTMGPSGHWVVPPQAGVSGNAPIPIGCPRSNLRAVPVPGVMGLGVLSPQHTDPQWALKVAVSLHSVPLQCWVPLQGSLVWHTAQQAPLLKCLKTQLVPQSPQPCCFTC